MKKNMIFIISIIVIFLILVGSIAYYRIVINGKINASSGNAVFVLKDENSNEWNNKEIDLGKVSPGDSGSFTVTMDASSSEVDMYATLELDKSSLPTNLKFYTTSDHKSELHKYYSFLEKDGTNKETLTIYWYWNPYIDDIEDSKFINIENIEANIKVSAVQISEYAMMKNGYSSDTSLNGGTEFWNNTYKPYIRTITFGNDLSNLPSECTEENLCWDISYDSNQNNKVYAYLINSGLKVNETDSTTNTIATKPLYNLYIVSEVTIFAPTNCNNLFKDFTNLMQIDFNNNLNTSKTTNMRYMFINCKSLTSIDLSGFNTSKVTDMTYVFYYCSSLTNIDLSSFNTSNTVWMGGIFESCNSLINLNLSNFNTSNVKAMWFMFGRCNSLTNIDLSSFDTSNVTDMAGMFMGCTLLKSLDLGNFDTSKVKSMRQMFNSCCSLTTLDLSSFDTSNVTSMPRMFCFCNSLTTLDLTSFNTTSVTNMECMFYDCYKLQTEITIMNQNVTDYTNMFLNAAIESESKIIINYTAETESLVDNMILTKSSNSNVVKGIQI